jgi:hypothetical protein
VLWLIFVILLVGILIGWALGSSSKGRQLRPPPPPPQIPDQFDPATLSSALGLRLAGAPANGAALPAPIGNQVIWVDSGDELLVHLDSIETRILDGLVIVSIDLESDQTGRTPMIVTFALGASTDPAGLVAVTDEYPHGDGLLATRWGEAVQAALWAALLGLAQDHAAQRGESPLGISAATGTMTLRAGATV